MADPAGSPPPPPSDPSSQLTQRSLRKSTQLSSLIVRRSQGEKLPLVIDVATGRASGANAKLSSSYLGVLSRTKVSILIPTWDDVEESLKNMIWADIQVTDFIFVYILFSLFLYSNICPLCFLIAASF